MIRLDRYIQPEFLHFNKSVGDKSLFHSLTSKKANKRRNAREIAWLQQLTLRA